MAKCCIKELNKILINININIKQYCMRNKNKKYSPNINLRYLPNTLSIKDKQKQRRQLLFSRKMYKQGKYFTRKSLKTFQSKNSPHIYAAKKMYGVNKIGATNELSKKSGCTKKALNMIISKGKGAYYSSGSRPNQTPQSWGIARLASALTSGKAGAVDYNILNNECKKGSKGYKMAHLARKRYGTGTKN
jgi:hypothetical protein